MTARMRHIFFRTLFASVAFSVGWLIYLVAALLTAYEGAESLIGQPIAAAFVSGLLVAVSVPIGLYASTRAPLTWFSRGFRVALAYSVGVISIVWLCAGAGPPLCIAYALLVFVIANWPQPRQNHSLVTDELRVTEDLHVLSKLQYFLAGLVVFLSSLPLAVILTVVALGKANQDNATASLPLVVAIYAAVSALGIAAAAFPYSAGRCIRRRRHIKNCQLIAALECLFLPLGTFVGIITLASLADSTTASLFQQANYPASETTRPL